MTHRRKYTHFKLNYPHQKHQGTLCSLFNLRKLWWPHAFNHSWSGILFHNNNGDILYREGPLFEGKTSELFLEKANLSLDQFNAEVDRVSKLFNANHVVFLSGDFVEVLNDIHPGDFILLNPPYPENERSAKVLNGSQATTPEEALIKYKELVSYRI